MKKGKAFVAIRILLFLAIIVDVAQVTTARASTVSANATLAKAAPPVNTPQATRMTAKEYGIEDFYQLALERAEKIKIVQEDVAIAKAGKGKMIAALLPRVSAFSSYTRYSESEYASGSLTLIQPETYRAWGTRVDYAFSLGGKEIFAYLMAEAQVQKKELDLRDAQESYLLVVGASFYDLLRAKKGLDIAIANSQRLKAYVQAAQSRLKVGEITRTVLLRAQSEYYGAESERVKAESALANAKNLLARLVNIDSDFEIKEKTEPSEKQVEAPAYYQVLAIANRDDLKALQLNQKIADNSVRSARSTHLPYLSLSGVYQRNDQSPISPTLNKESAYAAASINFPIFEGGLRLKETDEALAKRHQAQLAYEDLRAGITTELQVVHNELMAILSSLQYQRAQTEYAVSNFEAVDKQFEYGLASSLDVIDANTLLVGAQRKLLDTEYSFQAALLKMKRTTGTLLREFQNEPIKK